MTKTKGTEVFEAREVERGREPSAKYFIKVNRMYYACPSKRCNGKECTREVKEIPGPFGKPLTINFYVGADLTEHEFVACFRLDEESNLSLWRCRKCKSLDWRLEA
jgi:hypothetical protein